jgi:hypothetical protein
LTTWFTGAPPWQGRAPRPRGAGSRPCGLDVPPRGSLGGHDEFQMSAGRGRETAADRNVRRKERAGAWARFDHVEPRDDILDRSPVERMEADIVTREERADVSVQAVPVVGAMRHAVLTGSAWGSSDAEGARGARRTT